MTTTSKRQVADAVALATRAHTDLTVFHAVVAILEGGTLSGDTSARSAASKIIAICEAEKGRQLKKLDAARASAVA